MKLRFNGVAKLLVLLLLAALMAACFAAKEPRLEPTEPTPKGTVSYHVWGVLISYGIEQKAYPGYAVYTYVLFNRNGS